MSSQTSDNFDLNSAPKVFDNSLTQDKVLSIDEIKQTLNHRVRPEKIAFVVDQSIKYTIEDVYKNELENRKKQVEADIARERIFVNERIDEKDEVFYKGNDTYLKILYSEKNVINSLLSDLEEHKLFVEIKFAADKVILTGQKKKQVKRDGVFRTEIYPMQPMEVDNDIFESKAGNGYKLSIEKIKQNEDAFHDKKMMQQRNKKEEEKKEESEGQEQQEVVDEKPAEVEQQEVEQNEEVAEQAEQPIEEEVKEEVVEKQPKIIQPKTLGIESEGVQNIINNLGDFKGNQVFKQNGDDWLESLVDDVLADAELSDDDFSSVLGADYAKKAEPQSSYSQARATKQFERERYVEDDDDETEYRQPTKPAGFAQRKQEAEKLMTEHEMKIENFKTAANEIKQKIIKCYGGDEEKAKRDQDYINFVDFVKNKLQVESTKDYMDQEIEDWNDEENREYMMEDLQNKRETFKKRYNDEFFTRISGRAKGPGF